MDVPNASCNSIYHYMEPKLNELSSCVSNFNGSSCKPGTTQAKSSSIGNGFKASKCFCWSISLIVKYLHQKRVRPKMAKNWIVRRRNCPLHIASVISFILIEEMYLIRVLVTRGGFSSSFTASCSLMGAIPESLFQFTSTICPY